MILHFTIGKYNTVQDKNKDRLGEMHKVSPQIDG